MPVSTWIRDVLGIRKDIIDTEKSKLEIDKLKAEDRERNLITPASLDDVKKYDPKTQALLRGVSTLPLTSPVVALFVILILLAAVAFLLLSKW